MYFKSQTVFFLHFLAVHSASTRKLYEKKLQKLLDQPPLGAEAPAEVTTLPKADSNQNGNTNSDQYSDKEDGELWPNSERGWWLWVSLFCFVVMVFFFYNSEDTAAPEPEPVPVVEKPVRSRGKTPVTVRTSSRRQTKVGRALPVALRERGKILVSAPVYLFFFFYSSMGWRKCQRRPVTVLLKTSSLMKLAHRRASGNQ